ncbi:MAG TPA: hypothetical protein DFR83_13605, partial [Deltaproteobacteria bacterium]|nr:hypothetical protein [Deltaproteobacteria bacterium]
VSWMGARSDGSVLSTDRHTSIFACALTGDSRPAGHRHVRGWWGQYCPGASRVWRGCDRARAASGGLVVSGADVPSRADLHPD